MGGIWSQPDTLTTGSERWELQKGEEREQKDRMVLVKVEQNFRKTL